MNISEQFVTTSDITAAVQGHENKIIDVLGINWQVGHPHIRCPYPDHRDENPSWRWDQAKRKAFCTCGNENIFGILMKVKNVDYEAAKICAAKLINRSDLIRHKKIKRSVVAHFDYLNETGDLLFQVLRYEPKGFSQRPPNGNGGWIEGKDAMKGVRLVPYRLPELIDSIKREQTIFIPEGEKHVDQICSLGFAATCNAMGAGKWRKEYAQFFRGADVVVLPDQDKTGQNHAQDIANYLSPVAKRVRVLALPGLKDKGDIIDWLDAGGTVVELLRLANETPDWQPAQAHIAKENGGNDGDGGDGDQQGSLNAEGRKQADTIINLVMRHAELFHTPDGTGHADVRINGHRETWEIQSKGFRLWMTRSFYESERSAPSSDARNAALNVLEAKARYEGVERSVCVRVAGDAGKLYVDLGTSDWSAIEVDKGGWRVVQAPPVRFRRAKGYGPLPIPVPGGSITALRPFLNLKGDDDFILAVAWLLAAFRDRGPYPVLVLTGEQGSAKSTLARVLKRLVDPNTAALRKLATTDRDLFIAAKNGYALAYDNVSTISDWLSDALCSLATGGGYGTRELYTNDEEALFDSQRPIILNGIEDFVTRGDLADRSVTLQIPKIDEKKRCDEENFWADFIAAAPAILGALFDVISHALKALPTVKLDRKPRMADFAKWIVACEGALPWKEGSFMAAYDRNRLESVDAVLESDPVALSVRQLLSKEPVWNGTAAELLMELNSVTTEDLRKHKKWPKTPRGMGGALRRVAPELRRIGYRVDLDDRDSGKNRDRRYNLAAPDNTLETPSEPSEPSGIHDRDDFSTDDPSDDTVPPQSQPSDRSSDQKPVEKGCSDDLDDLDGSQLPLTSEAKVDDLMPRKKVAI